MVFWILAIVFSMIIFDRIRRIYRIHQCPNDQTLVKYFEGKLQKEDEAGYEQTISHLGVCEKCQSRLVDIANTEEREGGPNLEDHLI